MKAGACSWRNHLFNFAEFHMKPLCDVIMRVPLLIFGEVKFNIQAWFRWSRDSKSMLWAQNYSPKNKFRSGKSWTLSTTDILSYWTLRARTYGGKSLAIGLYRQGGKVQMDFDWTVDTATVNCVLLNSLASNKILSQVTQVEVAVMTPGITLGLVFVTPSVLKIYIYSV